MSPDDEDADIRLTKSRGRHYIGTEDETLVMSHESFPLRMVRVWLDEDKMEYEILASNLSRDQFPDDCFGELYHQRWRIETAYQTLEDCLQMEKFAGTKPILLEQDIYSTIYVSNIAENIARDIEQEQAEHLKNDYKHRMAVNRTLCSDLLKSDLICIFLEKDPQKQELSPGGNELFGRAWNKETESEEDGE